MRESAIFASIQGPESFSGSNFFDTIFALYSHFTYAPGGFSMNDKVVRFLSDELQIRAVTADTTESVAEAQRRHGASPTATAALGRTITAAALLGTTLKMQNTLTIIIDGNGPLGRLVATCDASGNVRGYVQNSEVNLPPNEEDKLNVADAVGRDGHIGVIYDMGLKKPYQGSAPLVSGEIGVDVAYYLTASEQIPSAVGLGVLVSTGGTPKASGGFMIQALPEENGQRKDSSHRDDILNEISARTQDLGSISRLIDQDITHDQIVNKLTGEIPVRRISSDQIQFKCECDKQRAENILMTMDEEEIEEILAELQQIEVTCEFCRGEYRFDAAEVARLIKEE